MDKNKGLVDNLREGVEIIKMILFMKLKKELAIQYPTRGDEFRRLLAASIINELFGTPNPNPPFKQFSREHNRLIKEELQGLAKRFPDMLIPLTDALRMHFLCNYCQDMPDYSAEVLARAKEYGILLEDRDVPLPKGFMEMVYRVGKAYGLVKEQEVEKGKG